MRIAQVAPLTESVPPQLYGGTERVVAYLTDELLRLGHKVTLFASGDSQTPATLVPMCPTALRLCRECRDSLALHVLMLEQVAQRAEQFDIIHFHLAHLHFPVVRRLDVAHVTTLHGRLDIAELRPLYREFRDIPLVSISDAQRDPLPDAGWIGTVHHGLPLDLLAFHPEPGSYLAFLGRISPEKRVDRAIANRRRPVAPRRARRRGRKGQKGGVRLRGARRERVRPAVAGLPSRLHPLGVLTSGPALDSHARSVA